MGYLGLSEPIEKEDNLFTRLFWPGDHPGEVDHLGQQGFWICIGVAIVSGLLLFIQGHVFIAALTLAFFGLGGMGIREHSVAAAIFVAVAYIANQAAAMALGAFPGFFGIAASVLLIANIRGTWIASKWARLADPETFPERRTEKWHDRLVDQLPAQLWPGVRIAFFCVAGLYITLFAAGTIVMARRPAHPSPQAQTAPSQIEVAPPQ